MHHDAILEALGDGTRRTILAMLRTRPHCVGELADALPVTQPAVSQHLRVLREAGLVTVRKEGRRRFHSLRAEGFEPLRSFVSSYWDQALESFQASFEPAQPGPTDLPKEQRR